MELTKDVRVSVSLSDLLAIVDVIESYPVLVEEVSSLKKQVHGVRNVQAEIMCMVGDLRREKK